jgi:transposase
VLAYWLKEDSDGFWDYVSSPWAGKFLGPWSARLMRSKIEPMKKVAKTMCAHKPLILNWLKAKKAFSSGIVQGLNNKAKVTTRKSYRFRTYCGAEIVLYHTLGNLPTPPMTHRFC